MSRLKEDNREYREALGRRIRTAREAAGLSVTQLAQRLEYGVGAVDSWERSNRRPPIDVLHAMSQILKISLSGLLTGVESNDYKAGWNDCARAVAAVLRLPEHHPLVSTLPDLSDIPLSQLRQALDDTVEQVAPTDGTQLLVAASFNSAI